MASHLPGQSTPGTSCAQTDRARVQLLLLCYALQQACVLQHGPCTFCFCILIDESLADLCLAFLECIQCNLAIAY